MRLKKASTKMCAKSKPKRVLFYLALVCLLKGSGTETDAGEANMWRGMWNVHRCAQVRGLGER